MREIKFRSWDGKQMHYFDLSDTIAPSLEENVMQFTGLKDKNGKEIYEGDIVKTEYGVGYSSKHYPSYKDGSQRIGKLTVEWEHCGFNLQFPYDGNFEMTFEVIGNIHQNPDLL